MIRSDTAPVTSLLREAGRRLQELAGARAEVARIGGDEFALILSHVDDERDAARLRRADRRCDARKLCI